ncbi:mechanosensitive ion channel family protein [Caenibius sp. WL]|uniref:mechanosensitive ion channel family protein n=1 Tax=Caenibius sp. WL TaxID=2872646 RepID=UPI001C99716C|nr:mechanosensitive ion channel family protein [Caenibius sp. WL]QZP09635.1 mechanosensitive ion channel family protein [Caenibius sp. WL]
MRYLTTLQRQTDSMIDNFVATLPSLVIAMLVILFTWGIARFSVHIANRITRRTSLRPDLRQLIETLVRLAIWIFGLLIAATVVMPGLTPASLVAGLGVGAVAIGFAFQDILENFLAGVLIMLRDKMQIGDMVEANNISGRVEKITLRETHIRQPTNELTILPNSMMFKNPVKIITDTPVRRNEVVVKVASDCDLPTAEAVIRKAVSGVEQVNRNHPIGIYAQQFSGGSIDFLVQWWTNTSENDFGAVKSNIIFAVKKALDDAQIPFSSDQATHIFIERDNHKSHTEEERDPSPEA